MKKLLKIGALSLALVASIFLLSNTTKAANGDVTLEITGQSGYCIVGYHVPYGQTGFSYAAYSITDDFNTTSGTNTRFCDDSKGEAPRTVELAADTVHNMTTANSAHDIANTRLHVTNDAATKTAGQCTPNIGTSNGSPTALGTQVVLFGKTSATGEVCTVETQNVTMTIDLTGSQALGMYSGDLTITIPSRAQ